MRHSSVVQLVEHLTVNQNVAGSSPAGGAMMLTVAQSVEHLVVIQKAEGSLPFCQPKKKNNEQKLIFVLTMMCQRTII